MVVAASTAVSTGKSFGFGTTNRVRVQAVPLASWAAVGSDFLSEPLSPFPEPGLTSAASWLLDRLVVRLDRKMGDETEVPVPREAHRCVLRPPGSLTVP